MDESFRINDYKKMMEDEIRMKAYQEAISACCPGKKVCEIGVGLGPLSLMALKAGAARVYGIERLRPLLDIATRIIRSNGFDENRFVPLHGMSTDVALPEKVDLIISETLDNLGVGENTIHFMQDARRRFLNPGGSILPRTLDCYLALANPEGYQEELRFWTEELEHAYGLDYRKMGEALAGTVYPLTVRPDELHSVWRQWQHIRFDDLDRFKRRSPALFMVEKTGEVTGTIYAFKAQLSGDVTLSTLPEDPLTHWSQGFVPFRTPYRVQRGDVMHIEIEIIQGVSPIWLHLKREVTHIPAAEAKAYLIKNYGSDL